MKTCNYCKTPLQGEQKKWCSDNCCQKYYYHYKGGAEKSQIRGLKKHFKNRIRSRITGVNNEIKRHLAKIVQLQMKRNNLQEQLKNQETQ